MNPLEIISLIFAIAVIVKFVVFLAIPDLLLKLTTKIAKKTKLINVILVILILVVGYFVLSQLTIIQVIPALWLGSMMFALLFLQYPKKYVTWVKQLMKDKNKIWFFWVIWLVIAAWVLYVLFL